MAVRSNWVRQWPGTSSGTASVRILEKLSPRGRQDRLWNDALGRRVSGSPMNSTMNLRTPFGRSRAGLSAIAEPGRDDTRRAGSGSGSSAAQCMRYANARLCPRGRLGRHPMATILSWISSSVGISTSWTAPRPSRPVARSRPRADGRKTRRRDSGRNCGRAAAGRIPSGCLSREREVMTRRVVERTPDALAAAGPMARPSESWISGRQSTARRAWISPSTSTSR